MMAPGDLSVFKRLARRINQFVQPSFHVVAVIIIIVLYIRHNLNMWRSAPKVYITQSSLRTPVLSRAESMDKELET